MNIYNTNIDNITCSCEDWKQTRSTYPQDDPRRLCKHLINKMHINSLPTSLKYFIEDIEFYKTKEWGFRQDFEKVLTFPINNLTILMTLDWMNIYDSGGNKYGYLNDIYTGEHLWAKNKKPIGYEEVEEFFKKQFKPLPLSLQGKEKSDLIKYIKEVIPNKQNIQFSIEDDQYAPSPDGIYYCLYESTSDYPLEEEVRYIIVKNNEIIIEMYYGETFQYNRDYEYAKQLKNSRELNERLAAEEREIFWKEQEKLSKEKLEQKREIALEKGYMLSQDYKGDLYDIQYFHYNPEGLSADEYEKIKNNTLEDYGTIQNLLKEYSLNITSGKFNKALKSCNFITKEISLNQNDWILKGDGLNYGINLIKFSRNMHMDTPDWYKVHIFDSKKMKLRNLDSNINIKMTSVLFKKDKFNELYQLVTGHIEHVQVNNKLKDTTQNSKQLERENWLRHVSCPNCGEKTNIHKKDKRQRKNFQVQRYQCMDCKSIFQERIEEISIEVKNIELSNDIVENSVDNFDNNNNDIKPDVSIFGKIINFFNSDMRKNNAKAK